MTSEHHDASDPVVLPAYCAPGYRDRAEQILRERGEWPCEIIEHPYMTGRYDVIITSPGTLFPAFNPMEYREDLARAWATWSAGERHALQALMDAETREGIAAGGTPCCGTKSAWHRPWCYTGGPYHHRGTQESSR